MTIDKNDLTRLVEWRRQLHNAKNRQDWSMVDSVMTGLKNTCSFIVYDNDMDFVDE